ncbi:hypothetical protein SAMN05216218_107108 [Halorientalis regularis]|jgi:hypothetical protein|uniref:Uncharacterized protein n=1 Tax=Halorientalis regularis TaxID=660518 RepID=A0A1G7M215_9EURY|nr:hypothetical protein SAMN05216218_107108 [Halorientalis regularis]
MSRDEFSTKQEEQIKRYVIWTAVTVIAGFIVLYVV